MTEEKLLIENNQLRNIIIQQQLELAKYKSIKQVSSMSFTNCYDLWLKSQKKKIQSSTYHEYVSIYKRDIKPYFENYNLSDITSGDIEAFYQSKLSQGLSVHTVHRMHANLFTMFKFAITNDKLLVNPFDKVTRPKDNYQYIANYYNIDQLIELINISRSNKIFPAILFAAILGLRRSEILGLKWDAINFNNKCLMVKRKVTRNKSLKKDELSNNLKTQASYRTLPLPHVLQTYLCKLKELQSTRAQSYDYCKTYLDYICVDSSGKLLTLNTITNSFRYLIQVNGFPKIRFHDLRHSCATMLIHLGYSMKEIQMWLGHSNYNTTAKFYTHISLDDKTRMANKLNDVFSNIVRDLSE